MTRQTTRRSTRPTSATTPAFRSDRFHGASSISGSPAAPGETADPGASRHLPRVHGNASGKLPAGPVQPARAERLHRLSRTPGAEGDHARSANTPTGCPKGYPAGTPAGTSTTDAERHPALRSDRPCREEERLPHGVRGYLVASALRWSRSAARRAMTGPRTRSFASARGGEGL